MAEKVVIKIKKVNGENVIRIKGNPESKYHINLMAQKLRLGEIKPTKRLKIKRFFKKLNRVVKQLAEEICNQPKVDRIKPPMMAEQIQPNIYLDFKEEVLNGGKQIYSRRFKAISITAVEHKSAND